MNDTICLILAVVGIAMIAIGVWMTYQAWRAERFGGAPSAREESLAKNLEALAKLVAALKNSPPGMSLIVLGIVLLLIALAFCGVSGLAEAISG